MGEQINPLRSCPFCGGEPVAVDDDSVAYIMCSNCGAKGPENIFRPSSREEFWECCKSKHEAIRLACLDWNNRCYESNEELALSCFEDKKVKPLRYKVN